MFSEDPILLPEIVDQIVLVTVHPASEREDEELQRRRHSLRLLGRLDQHRPSLGRFFAPYGVYLHFGYEHESDLSYGDSDYERWNVGTPTWTFSPAASTTSGSAVTHPTLTEHGRYPGVFLVTCAASNGRPTGSDTNADTDDGFSVRVSAAHGSPSVTYTASAAHPTYPRICKP